MIRQAREITRQTKEITRHAYKIAKQTKKIRRQANEIARHSVQIIVPTDHSSEEWQVAYPPRLQHYVDAETLNPEEMI